MDVNRRLLMAGAGLAAGAAAVAATPEARAAQATTVDPSRRYPPGRPGADYRPVTVPNGVQIPFATRGDVKIAHIVIGEATQRFAPGLDAQIWGFNGVGAGAYLEAVEGDRVRLYVTNRLKAPTSVHWHGLILPSGMDGVGGLTQRNIEPGETFVYEFPLVQHGTFMFHAHHDEMAQMGLGMTGLFIVHPRRPRASVDRDFAFLIHEWKIRPGARRPDPNEMTDFNVFTLNGRVFPAIDPMAARVGERVRIRFANLSQQNHHSMHIHGHVWTVTETDGGVIPETARWPETTVLVPVGTTRTVEFVAAYPGDWALHCHMLHHVMNQMGHGAGNMIGVDDRALQARVADLIPDAMVMGGAGMGDHGAHIEAGHMAAPENSIPMVGLRGPRGYIPMGGLVQLLQVRAALPADGKPGWYDNPPGTEARPATPAELARDGVVVDPRRDPR
ncbi:MAG: multicopper oxidase domain-containing protein [Alphaproteobacteria bacterium]|nr:multicopper oxidase domain-containing protein [Alphaproteobacteria bacterium]